MRSGSARRRTAPFDSSAVISASMLAPLLTRLASAVPNGAAVVPASVPAALSAGTPAPAGGRRAGGVDAVESIGRGACDDVLRFP